jgi:mannose-1-phosphate guanylyltransferase/mannose-1-phosphate guanylyltransferase/phosphomannomutase
MILAAGFGTRFQPVTFTLPKPLIPVCNKPLIGWVIESFLAQGVSDFVVNLHHLPDAIRDYLPRAYPRTRFEFSFEEEILGTGGGVRRARKWLDGEDDFFLANGDTIQFVPAEALRRARGEREAIAALALRHPPEGDYFTPVYFEDGRITGFGSGTGEALMFSGSHCIARRVFDLMPDQDVFGMVDAVYQPLLRRGETIAGVVDDDAGWFDIGTPRRYLAASQALCGGNVVGARSVVEGTLIDSVVWDDCRIAAGVTLERCVAAHGVTLTEPAHHRDVLITPGETRPI